MPRLLASSHGKGVLCSLWGSLLRNDQGFSPLVKKRPHYKFAKVAGGAGAELLTLCRLAAVVLLIELFQLRGARRFSNHLFRVVRELPHDFKQFPLPTNRNVQVDSG